jgi:hypothetical protein
LLAHLTALFPCALVALILARTIRTIVIGSTLLLRSTALFLVVHFVVPALRLSRISLTLSFRTHFNLLVQESFLPFGPPGANRVRRYARKSHQECPKAAWELAEGYRFGTGALLED